MKGFFSSLVLAVLTQSSAQGQPPQGMQPANPPFAAHRPIYLDIRPARACESLTSLTLPNTTIERAAADDGVCRVTAIVTHPPAGDRETVWVALPIDSWNGRFQGTGGGGMSGGSEGNLRAPGAAGYATAATDTGHEGG